MEIDRKEKAMEIHDKGCNCCQAVTRAFAEDLGMDERAMHMAGEAFGLGMGGMQGTCGALSGALMVLGMKASDGNLETPRSKVATYKIAREIHDAFAKRAGSTVCRELKGEKTGQPLMPCADCIRLGVQLVEELLGL